MYFTAQDEGDEQIEEMIEDISSSQSLSLGQWTMAIAKTKTLIKSKTTTKWSSGKWPLKILNLITNHFFAEQQPTDDPFQKFEIVYKFNEKL